MDAKKLGKKIKLARIEHDMTQGDLAEAIGALQKSISRYETGTSLPSLETLEKIAKTLKKPFGYFLDDWSNKKNLIRILQILYVEVVILYVGHQLNIVF